MLSNKPSLGFHSVLKFNFAVIALALLMTITALGVVGSRLGFLESAEKLTAEVPIVPSFVGSTPTYTATSTPTPFQNVRVGTPNIVTGLNSSIEIPINVLDSLSGSNVISFQLALWVNNQFAVPDANPIVSAGTMSSGWTFTTIPAADPGSVIVKAFGSTALSGTGVLMKLKYTTTGNNGASGMCLADQQDSNGNYHIGMGWNEGGPPWSGPGYVDCGYLYNGSSPTATPTFTSTNTPTNTATPSGTATNTPTATPATSISGTITYDNAIGSPAPPRYVSNVVVASTAGSPSVSTTSDGPGATAGYYLLTGFGSGSYTIAPSKSGGVNSAVTSFDAARIAQHVAGINTLTGNPLIVADASNNGSVTSFDAGYVAKFAAGISPCNCGVTGDWKFNPVSRTYSSVPGTITGEDYAALLMGEVSGNWTNTGARPVHGPERGIEVTVPNLVANSESEVRIPISARGVAAKGIISYEFDLRYDSAIMTPMPNPVDLLDSVSQGLVAVANPIEPGLLRIVVYGPMPIEDDGTLLHLRFTTIGKPGSVSPLTWELFMFNEGAPNPATTDGYVKLIDVY